MLLLSLAASASVFLTTTLALNPAGEIGSARRLNWRACIYDSDAMDIYEYGIEASMMIMMIWDVE